MSDSSPTFLKAAHAFKMTCRTFLALTVIGSVAISLTAGASNIGLKPVRATAPPPTVNLVAEAVETARANVAAAAAEAKERVSDEVAGTTTTAKLDTLAEQVDARILASTSPLPREAAEKLGLLTGAAWFEDVETVVAEVKEAAEATITGIDKSVVAWETELEAERERIRIAKAKAKAEAEARARAAAAAAASRSWSGPARSGESAANRIARLARRLPFRVPYVLGHCSISPIGCYVPGNDYVVVSPALASRRDCRVVYALAHEYRHLQQYNAGKIQTSNGKITNRGWLEHDAQIFGYRYGCRP